MQKRKQEKNVYQKKRRRNRGDASITQKQRGGGDLVARLVARRVRELAHRPTRDELGKAVKSKIIRVTFARTHKIYCAYAQI